MDWLSFLLLVYSLMKQQQFCNFFQRCCPDQIPRSTQMKWTTIGQRLMYTSFCSTSGRYVMCHSVIFPQVLTVLQTGFQENITSFNSLLHCNDYQAVFKVCVLWNMRSICVYVKICGCLWHCSLLRWHGGKNQDNHTSKADKAVFWRLLYKTNQWPDSFSLSHLIY